MSSNPHQSIGETPVAKSIDGRAMGANPIAPTPAPGSGTVPDPALQTLLTFSSLHEELQHTRKELARSGVSAEHIRAQVLQTIAERALAISGASGVAIALAEGRDIVCRGTAGDTAPPLGLKLDLRSGLTAVCFQTGTVVRCDDADKDLRVDREACRSLGVRSVVAVPLRAQQSILGLIEAFEKESFAFTDGDIRELSLLAELTVEAIQSEAPRASSGAAAAASDLTDSPAGQTTSLGDWTQLAGSTAVPARVSDSALTAIDDVPERVPFSSYPATSAGGPWGPRVTQWGIAALLFAVVAGGGAWWRSHRAPSTVTAQFAAPTATTAPSSTPSSAQAAENGLLPHITGLRHWSNNDTSTVVIDLQDEVPYEIHRLASPERIYVDLHDAALSPELAGKSMDVEDALLSRIKIGPTAPGVTRVELETKNSSNFSVSLEPNPYRMVLEIRSLQAAPKPKMDTQAVWQNTTHPTFPEISKTPTAEDTRLRAHVPKLRIVVDAGHGGWDMGTVGQQGLLEKDLALEIAQRLGVLLEQRLGLEVIYTRSDDTFVPLGRRAAIANQVGADLFVSVHANYSSESAARGVETYYTSNGPSTQVLAEEEREVGSAPTLQLAASELREKSEASRKLATSVQQSLYGTLASKSPGVRNRGVKAASFVVLTGTTMPAILAEVSFVSSPTDEHNLQDPFYRQNIAEALYRGIARYAAGTHKTNVASAAKRDSGL